MRKAIVFLMVSVSLTMAPISANADMGKTPSETAREAGVQSFARKAWHSPRVDAYAWHPKGKDGQDDQLLQGTTEVVGFVGGKSVIEIVYLTDAQISKWPEGKALLAILSAYSGSLDWVQMNDSEENQVWKIDGQTAVLASKSNAVVIMDDDWVDEVTLNKVFPFVAEVTAWTGNQ